MRKGILLFVALAFALTLAAPALAGDAPQDKPAAKPALRTELVRLKYFPGHAMLGFINTYLSRDGRVSQGPDSKILVVSDYPENIERVLQAVRQIDVKPADLQFTVQLVQGSEADEKTAESVANDPVIKELRNLLKYKSYSLLDTSMIRALDDRDTEVRLGERAEFEFWIKPKVVRDEKAALIQMEVRLRRISLAPVPPNVTSSKVEYISTSLIGTTLNAKPGEKTVVGVSKLDGTGKGLILIISGKIVE